MKKFLIRGGLVAGILVLLSLYPLSRLGAWLVVEDPLQKADAIVVLGGSMYERLLEGADLYNAGYAPRIYLVRELPDWGELELVKRGVTYTRVVDLQADVLVTFGVPRDAITILDPANSTAQEAGFVLGLSKAQQLSRVIIVTSRQHTRRAKLVMERQLAPAGTQVIMRATRYDRTNVDRWWGNRSAMRFTIFETQRWFLYWIGLAD